MKYFRYYLFAYTLLLSLVNSGWADTALVTDQPEVVDFIENMSENHGFEQERLTQTLQAVNVREDSLAKLEQPVRNFPWFDYQAAFITEDRINRGVAFWQEHADTLANVELSYGIPAEIIVAILGQETIYGSFTGRYPALDALATFAFYHPNRQDYFRKELREFLLLTREQGLKPEEVLSSFDGGLGIPQFMPSSYRAYAVDFTGDGKRDLFTNVADAIGSVANYLKEHGWQQHGLIAIPAEVFPVETEDGESAYRYQDIANETRQPNRSLSKLAEYGVKPVDDNFTTDQQTMLIEMEGARGPEFWIAFHNFYVITRYNTSPKYALAVMQLSQAIKTKHEESVKQDTA